MGIASIAAVGASGGGPGAADPRPPAAGPPRRANPAPTTDTLSGLRAELAEAIRQRDAARPAVARTAERLSPQDRVVVDRLRQRDAQVRQEETAHAGVAGSMAGPISYVYQRGPDGRQYAVGGSVAIAVRAVTGDVEEARRLGARMAAAALAATNPSAADLSAAARAYRLGTAISPQAGPETDPTERRGAALDRQA